MLDTIDRRWTDLIATLYDAVTSSESLGRISEILIEVSGGRSSAVCVFGEDQPEFITSGIPEEAVDAYRPIMAPSIPGRRMR